MGTRTTVSPDMYTYAMLEPCYRGSFPCLCDVLATVAKSVAKQTMHGHGEQGLLTMRMDACSYKHTLLGLLPCSSIVWGPCAEGLRYAVLGLNYNGDVVVVCRSAVPYSLAMHLAQFRLSLRHHAVYCCT